MRPYLIGILVAVGLGALLHRGVLRINLSRYFTWTGAALIIVAGGVLAYGLHDLQEAGILPGLHNLAFDVSHVIAPGGFLGTLLKGIFNFSPATTWIEAVTWIAYVVPVTILYFRKVRTHNGPKRATSSLPLPT